MPEVENKSSTADDQAGADDNQEDKTTDPKTTEAPDESAKSADVDDQGGDDDDASGSDGDGAGDPAAKQKRDAEGYKIRHLINDNPVVKLVREKLQPVVDATQDESARKDLQRDLNDYVKDIAQVHDVLQRDNEQVAKEIPIFRVANPDGTPNPEFNKSLLDRALAQYARDMAIYDENGVRDANGNPIIVGYRMRLLDYMREKAEDYGFGSKKTRNQDKQMDKKSNDDKDKAAKKKADQAKMDAAADTPGGKSPAEGKGKTEADDPFMQGFNDPYGRHKPEGAHAFSGRK